MMASLEGKWKLIVKTFMGDMRSLHELKVKGTKVTGIVIDIGTGNKGKVEDGKLDGDSFSYSVTVNTPVGEMTNHLTGSVNAEGNMISGKSKNAMGEFEFSASRVQ